MKKAIAPAVLILGVFCSGLVAQEQTTNADQTLRGTGRVNPSTLAMEINIPLANYPGRGMNVPISLSYSSKLWRMEYTESVDGTIISPECRSFFEARYSEASASGWSTSLATPYIEYTDRDNIYTMEGHPRQSFLPCDDSFDPSPNAFIPRLMIRLPSGESHELRADDNPIVYSPSSVCPPAGGYACDPNSPALQQNWNRTYYAVDGSNLRYEENSNTNTYRLFMPDGSFYDFENTGSSVYGKSARKAIKFTDRNGNHTDYNTQTGVWTDSIGRSLTAPIGLNAPAEPTSAQAPITYSVPGMTGNYKFHWKRLKGDTASESGLTDFGQSLRYYGNITGPGYGNNWTALANGTYLFASTGESWIRAGSAVFNPIVLTKIELPTGQSYVFSYNVYGLIDRISYPTGGEERFIYQEVPQLTLDDYYDASDRANLGVTNRKLYPAPQGSPYEWTYGAQHVAPAGYKISITSPENILTERFLHQGYRPCGGCDGMFGYDSGLAGMPYQELVFDSSNPRHLISRKLSSWSETKLPLWISHPSYPGGGFVFGQFADWHPRLNQEESILYDSSGSGVSTTVRYEYEGNLDLRETPLLVKKTTQYAFVGLAGGQPLQPDLPEPGESPDPSPSPVPTPVPPSPVKIVENTYLLNDSNYDSVKSYYAAQNMVGLVTVSRIKDGDGTLVSRTDTVYDEPGRSPGYRGNPTSLRGWDNTKGADTDPNAYVTTRARFDSYGNQYESTDAKGNTTTTTFDSTYHAYPFQVTSPVPDPSNTNGANSEFVTTSTFEPVTGLPLTTTDANGLETRIAYDPVTLRPLNTKTYYNNVQVGATRETIYNDQPNNYWVKNRSQIDTNSWVERILYFDGLGRTWKTEEVNSKGNIFVEKEFDADGRVLRVSNPYRSGEAKVWITYVYDEASRVKEVILQDGATIRTDYGVSVASVIGVTKQITDQAGKKRKGISDALGRMVRVVEDPSGQAFNTDYVFDTLGNLRQTIQDQQNRYFMHDSLGRLLYSKQPEQDTRSAFVATDPVTGNTGWSFKYEYDNNGNITKVTDSKGDSINASYDNLNRLKVRDYSNVETPDVTFFYDGKGLGTELPIPRSKGRTTKIANVVSETRYTFFDELGRLRNHEQVTDGQTYSTQYEYNLAGGLVKETYPSGREIYHEINTDGDLSRVWGKKGAAVTTYANAFNYTVNGAIAKLRLGNGKWETAQYNNRMQVTQIALGAGANDTSLFRLDYSYNSTGQTDNNGSLREQKITVPNVGGTAGFTAVQTYSYDSLNRLQVAEENIAGNTTWKQTFVIDRYGNREFDAANTTTLGGCPQWVCNPDINTTDNRFTPGQGYTYDENGTVTRDAEGQRFGYDGENHQTKFFAADNSSNNPDATYFYDGDGRRIKKVTTAETIVFAYNALGQLVAEYSTQISQTPRVSYLTADHLGSPRVVTDQLGVVKSRMDYSAFGEKITSAQRQSVLGYASSAGELRKGYTGYEKDSESGLDFAEARYYNSEHGRYTSVDPLTSSANIRNPQSFNRYSYVLNSPYKYTDPLGLIPQGGGGFCSAEYSGCITGSDITTQSEEEYLMQQAQEAEPPPNAESYVHTGTTTYTFTYSRTDSNGVVAQIQFTITVETFARIDSQGNYVGDHYDVNAVAINGPDADIKFTDTELETAAKVASQTIASSLAAGFDPSIALGIVGKETFFGLRGSRRDRAVNPMQLTPNQFSGEPNAQPRNTGSASDLKHNIDLSIRLYREQKEPGRTLEQALKRYGDPNDRNYVADAVQAITEARRGINNATTKQSVYIDLDHKH